MWSAWSWGLEQPLPGRHPTNWWLNRFTLEGRRGHVVKAAGWLSLDRQLEPYLRANTVAPSWCGLGCRSRTLMVEYISPRFLPWPTTML